MKMDDGACERGEKKNEGTGAQYSCHLEMEKLKESQDTSLNEEEESLLVEGDRLGRGDSTYLAHSNDLPNVIITPSKSVSRCASERQTPVRLATPDPDIQLAEPKVDESPTSHRSSRGRSRAQRLCGPSPAKISTICLVTLSIWISWILIIHLNKELKDMAVRIEESNVALKTLEENSLLYRSQSSEKISHLQKQLRMALSHNRNRPEIPPTPSTSRPASSNATKNEIVPGSVPSIPDQDIEFDEDTRSHPLPTQSQFCTASGQFCLFPMIYKGVTYTSCVQAWTDIKPWCSVRLEDSGRFIAGDKTSWDYCQPCQ